MTTSIKPCGHHIVVKPIEIKKTTKSGIIIHHGASDEEKLERAGRMLGELVAVGPQAWKAHAASLGLGIDGQSDWASVGDMVLYSRHAGKYINDPITGEEIYLIHDEDVLAVLPPLDEWKIDTLELVK